MQEPTNRALAPGADVRDFLAQNPDFALHVFKKLIRLSRSSTDQVKSLALDDVYGRVTKLMRNLARDEDGVLVAPDTLTQQDIAERVGSSREMVSRVFKPLAEGGYVHTRGGRIALLKKLPARFQGAAPRNTPDGA